MSILLLRAFLALPLLAEAQTGENWRDVEGRSLRAMVESKEFADGVHFAYVFRTDSTFSGMEMGREEHGTWRIANGEWCWRWTRPAPAEECYRVQEDGARVRLMRNGSEAWSGTLRQIR